MSDARLDIVLFLAGSLDGIRAHYIELTEDEGPYLSYLVQFEKPGFQGPAIDVATDPDGFQYDQVIDPGETPVVDQVPDTSPTPEGVDYGEFPDLPSGDDD